MCKSVCTSYFLKIPFFISFFFIISAISAEFENSPTTIFKTKKFSVFSLRNIGENLSFVDEGDTPKMFSKLIFDDSVEFHAHEFVRIAQALLKETKAGAYPTSIPEYGFYGDQVDVTFSNFSHDLFSQAEKLYSLKEGILCQVMDAFYKINPSYIIGNYNLRSQWSNVMKSISSQKKQIFCKREYDKYILPAQVVPAYSTLGWLGLARYMQKAEEPISGWWVNIGNRLILLRNAPKQRMNFYVSDHGFEGELLHSTKQNLITFTDKGMEQQGYSFKFWNFYKKLSQDEKQLLEKRFILLLTQSIYQNLDKEFLLYTLSLPKFCAEHVLKEGSIKFKYGTCMGIKDEQKDPWIWPLFINEEKILEELSQGQYQAYKNILDFTLESVRYRGDIQTSIYAKSLFNGHQGGLSSFFTQIDNIFYHSDAENYRIFFILKEIAKNVGNGLQEFLFRPLHCFGSREEGESYRGFAEAFNEYSKNPAKLPPYKLAREVRMLLGGNSLREESLYFLPNLTAAWFISEVVRNEVSILSGLILLDLIESGISLLDEETYNRYDWKHTLIHPKKPPDSRTKLLIKDLYGETIDLANFDGMHPMAHGGSDRHSKKPLGKEHLSPVQQKEGHLIIHWLHEKLKKHSTIKSMPVAGIFNKPEYDEINNLLKGKTSKKLQRKFDILQIIKSCLQERLNTLDNLLDQRLKPFNNVLVLEKTDRFVVFSLRIDKNS